MTSGARRAAGIAGVVLNAILVIGYPIAIFLGLTHLGARAVSVMVLAAIVPGLAWRLRKADRSTFWAALRVPIAILLLLASGIATDDPRFPLALPTLINAVLAISFAASLRSGAMPMIERFARLQDPAIDEPKMRHCRQWTIAWCGFFVVNGTTAAILALAAPLWWWTVYTGMIGYAAMGLFFCVEWLQRRARFGKTSARET